MRENIRVIFAYIASNFESNRMATKRSNIRNFEYESNIRPILKTQNRQRRCRTILAEYQTSRVECFE